MTREAQRRNETPANEPRMAPDEHKETPLQVMVSYLLFLVAGLLMLGAAYGLWLLLTRIF